MTRERERVHTQHPHLFEVLSLPLNFFFALSHSASRTHSMRVFFCRGGGGGGGDGCFVGCRSLSTCSRRIHPLAKIYGAIYI